MRMTPRDGQADERPQKAEASQLQTPNENPADDFAELLEIAKSIPVELETSQKPPPGR